LTAGVTQAPSPVAVGAPSLKCLSSERWSDLVPSCDKIECPDITTIIQVREEGEEDTAY
jgi:hypothetical protein